MKRNFKRALVAAVAAVLFTISAFASSVYVVKSGDTLFKIAKKSSITLNELLKANPGIKNNTSIRPGQRITIPGRITVAASYESQIINLVNAQRARHGLSMLTKSDTLAKVARCKSQDMITRHYFSHTSPTYGSPFRMMENFGVRFSAAGENIAMGQPSPQSVMNAWMNSPGHRSNILSASYNQIGVGAVQNSGGTWYWTQEFIRKSA